MYMPTTLPVYGTKAAELMQMQDRIIRTFPRWIPFGKAGRALTATDPRPPNVRDNHQLKPKTNGATASRWKACGKWMPPCNSWRLERLTQPIRARIDMLATASAPRWGSGLWHRPDRVEAVARQVEAVCATSRHHQRLCRTGDRWLLP